MNIHALNKIVRRTRLQRNIIFIASFVLLAANFLLVAQLFNQTNQVVLVPTNVSDGMVARGASDKRYIEALSLDAVYGLYNASPSSLDYGRAVISRIAAVKSRNDLLRHYDEVAKDIRDRDISTVFFPQRIEHNIDSLEVIVEGDLQTFLNTVLVSVEPRRILLTFNAEAGSVRLLRVSRLEVDS